MKNKKRKISVAILAALLIVCMVGGTVAWMTSTSELTNTFTVGKFETPDPNPDTPDPENPVPEKPLDPTDPYKDEKFNGNLYEPEWVPDSKLVPGGALDKDPYVGIGAGSEDAYVYVRVINNFTNVGFILCKGWAPVGTEGTDYTVDTTFANNTVADLTGETIYTGGIFKYTAGLTDAENKDKWTTDPVFQEILIDNDATTDDLTPAEGKGAAIKVIAFLHQMNDGNGNAINPDTLNVDKVAIDTLSKVAAPTPEVPTP